jgi:hypothetical protein
VAYRLGRQVHPRAGPDSPSDLDTPEIVITDSTALFHSISHTLGSDSFILVYIVLDIIGRILCN